MKTPDQEKNLERLLRASCEPTEPSFEDRLAHLVAEEVRACRSRPPGWVKWPAGIAAAAALAFAAWLTWHPRVDNGTPVGAVQAVYGTVLLGERALPAAGQLETLARDEWLQTLSGSRATLTLGDRSRLTARSRSRLRVEAPAGGAQVRLDQGFISVEAAHQAPGKHLSVEIPGGTLHVLGTEFNVHTAERTSRVTVTSGRVELDSGGKRLVVLPNTEAILEEGRPPEVRPLAPQVTELAKLQEEAETQAAATGTPIDSVALIELEADGTATLWFRMRVPKGTTVYTFPHGSRYLRVYTTYGTLIPLHELKVELPPDAVGLVAATPLPRAFVQSEAKHKFRLSISATGSTRRTLLCVRLPKSARVDTVSPAPERTGYAGEHTNMRFVVDLDVRDLIG